jgi:hypothetical protein
MEKFNIGPPKIITVIYVDQNVVEFNDVWAVEGDLLKDQNDDAHSIKIERQEGSNNKRFTYLGNAKIGEKYYVDSHKNNLPKY